MKTFILTLSGILILNFAFAKKVTIEEASLVAKNYYYQESGISEKADYSKINMQLSYIGINLLDTVFYAFSDYDNNGFILISADDRVKPILAFSNESIFDENNIPPSCELMLNSYSEQIIYAKSVNYIATEETSNDWMKLSSDNQSDIRVTETPSIPLLLTNWNQTEPYNDNCPVDANGPGGHALVGCVAISIGQIMKYYNYPEQGSGTNSYYASGYGTQSVNFGNSHYEFTNMPFSANEANEDLSTFLYHCGVGAEMNYGVNGSGASTTTALYAMQHNFNYSSSWHYKSRSSYSDTQWKNIIKNEIDNLRPMIYVGYDGQSGHAWNCDGYQNDLVHMNWGWGGSYNGFFNIDNLVVGGSNFSSWHKLAYNLYPGSNYPNYCSSVLEIWGTEGNFTDGSGPEKYNNNSNCFWEITPECGNNIEISFDFFNVKIGDTLFVYDGLSIGDPVLAKLTGEEEIPANIFTDKGGLLLNFVTNSNDVASGWTISYSVDFCSGTRITHEHTGTINDGSGNCNYKDASLCYWTINPVGAESVTIDFTEFDLNADIDNVKIYKNEVGNSNLVEKFNYLNPSHSLTINSDKIIVYFFSDSEGNAGGWELDYTSYFDPSSIDNIDLNELNIWPNPTNNNLYLSFDSNINNDINISIINSLGQEFFSLQKVSFANNNEYIIDVQSLPSGIYFISLTSNNQVAKKIFVKE